MGIWYLVAQQMHTNLNLLIPTLSHLEIHGLRLFILTQSCGAAVSVLRHDRGYPDARHRELTGLKRPGLLVPLLIALDRLQVLKGLLLCILRGLA